LLFEALSKNSRLVLLTSGDQFAQYAESIVSLPRWMRLQQRSDDSHESFVSSSAGELSGMIFAAYR